MPCACLANRHALPSYLGAVCFFRPSSPRTRCASIRCHRPRSLREDHQTRAQRRVLLCCRRVELPKNGYPTSSSSTGAANLRLVLGFCRTLHRPGGCDRVVGLVPLSRVPVLRLAGFRLSRLRVADWRFVWCRRSVFLNQEAGRLFIQLSLVSWLWPPHSWYRLGVAAAGARTGIPVLLLSRHGL